MSLNPKYPYRIAFTALIISNSLAFHECRRNPCLNTLENSSPKIFIETESTHILNDKLENSLDNYLHTASKNEATIEELNVPLKPEPAITAAAKQSTEPIVRAHMVEKPVDVTLTEFTPQPMIEQSIKSVVIEQVVEKPAKITLIEPPSSNPVVQQATKPVILEQVVEKPTEITLTESTSKPVIEQASKPNKRGKNKKISVKTTVVFTEDMLKNVPQGPLKIALLQIKKKCELIQEGNKSVSPITMQHLFTAGMGPIHGAVNLGNPAIVQLILQHGENVDRPGPNGNTPLHMAVMNGNQEIAKLLLQTYDADNTIVNKEGKTPIELAAEKFGINSPFHVLVKAAE